MLQDDVNARLQANESKESVKVPEPSNNSNPATTLGKESDTGLSKLDAEEEPDSTPVEEKVEAVAGAIDREEDSHPESTIVGPSIKFPRFMILKSRNLSVEIVPC